MKTPNHEQLLYLPPERIIPNPRQPRRHFDQQALNQLAASIRQQGVVQPIIVRESKHQAGYYELVAGERRWRAIQLAGLAEVPVVVKCISDVDLLEVALLENIQRENLTPIEEGACYRELLLIHQCTQEQLARRLGKDRSTISNMMRLLQLPAAIQSDLEQGRLSVGHARALLSLEKQQDQLALREQILKHKWSVRTTELQAKQRQKPHSAKPRQNSKGSAQASEINLQLRQLEAELSTRLGTKARISYHQGQGTISLEFYSLDDFDRLMERLK